MPVLLRRLLPALLAASAVWPAPSPAQDAPPSIADRTAGMERLPGLIPLHWDAATGTLWMEIARFDDDLLYVRSLAAGVGSNDIGLDRGQLAQAAHVGALRRDITRFLEAPADGAEAWEPPPAPPGSPIGGPGRHWRPEPFCSQWAGPARW